MEMKSMKLKNYQRDAVIEAPSINAPRYPYGLNIGLENEALERLGIEEKLPSVGDEVIIMAKAKVESVSMSENQDKTKNRRVQIQITDMALEPKKPEIDIQKSMYGE